MNKNNITNNSNNGVDTDDMEDQGKEEEEGETGVETHITSPNGPKLKKQKLISRNTTKQNNNNNNNNNIGSGSNNNSNNNNDIDVIAKENILKYCIPISEDNYKRDPTPLLQGCLCHACKNHSRAYIQHLLKANELLGHSLLYQHNVYQFIRLFDSCAFLGTSNMKEKWLEFMFNKYA
jgi:hypothetical protein